MNQLSPIAFYASYCSPCIFIFENRHREGGYDDWWRNNRRDEYGRPRGWESFRRSWPCLLCIISRFCLLLHAELQCNALYNLVFWHFPCIITSRYQVAFAFFFFFFSFFSVLCKPLVAPRNLSHRLYSSLVWWRLPRCPRGLHDWVQKPS
jgi:hypothetical protein